jgi:hypothetical protein
MGFRDMSQRYFQELHNTLSPEHKASGRVPLRQYVHSLKARSQSMANSSMREYLDEVFSAEVSCRFFKTFLLRFISDGSKSAGDDSSMGKSLPVFALARI